MTGKEILKSLLYFRTSSSLSFIATLRRTKSVPLDSSPSLTKEGDSFRQLGHHDAKKFKRMIFPLNSLRGTFPPPTSFNVKSGASTGTLNFSTPASAN